MTTVHFIMITTEDGEEIRNDCSSKFEYSHEAEEIMQSMECGVFDDDYVHYVPTKIVYELEEPPTAEDCWDGDGTDNIPC